VVYGEDRTRNSIFIEKGNGVSPQLLTVGEEHPRLQIVMPPSKQATATADSSSLSRPTLIGCSLVASTITAFIPIETCGLEGGQDTLVRPIGCSIKRQVMEYLPPICRHLISPRPDAHLLESTIKEKATSYPLHETASIRAEAAEHNIVTAQIWKWKKVLNSLVM